MFGEYLDKTREISPLIHCITNYVTVNDVANMVLACGASPVMADEPEEAEDIASIAQGLNINIGTLNKESIKAMEIAGKTAKRLGTPIVLDPVGAGASRLRTETALRLLNDLKPRVVRGNVSEIKALAAGEGNTKGVDANVADTVTEGNLDEMVAFAKDFAKETGSIVAVTGPIDLVADADKCYVIYNGDGDMGKITGTGCQLDGLIASFLAVSPEDELEATAAAVSAMGLAGELGKALLQEGEGNATHRNRIIDSVCTMTGGTLSGGAKYELR